MTAQCSGQHAAAVSSCASLARPTASRALRHEWRVAGVLSFLLIAGSTGAGTFPPAESWTRIRVAGNRAQLPHDLTLIIDPRGLAVLRGKLRAPLELDDHSAPTTLAVAMSGDLVGIKVTDGCNVVHEQRLGIRNLEARLANVAALADYHQRRWRESAAGFARALALDPTFTAAATNLAAAQVEIGDAAAAVKTLAPFLAPLDAATYARLVADRDLAPLLDRPEVAATRAAAPGTAKLKMTAVDVTLDGRFAFSTKYRLVAAVRGEASWGSCSRRAELVLLDSRGQVATRLPLFSLTESSTDEARNCPIRSSARVSVAARVAAAQRLLTDLGFSPAGDPGELSLTDKGLPRATFAGVKVGLVLGAGVARALHGNREIGSVQTRGEHLEAASFFDGSYAGLNAVVFEWSRDAREGCEATDPHEIQLLPVSVSD